MLIKLLSVLLSRIRVVRRNTTLAASSSTTALGLGSRVRVKIKVRVMEALVIQDEASYCRPVQPVQCF